MLRCLCALRPATTIALSSSRGGSGVGFFSTSVPRSSSDSPPLIALFGSYGIGEEDTNVILGKFPKLRASNVENILRPKLRFLRSTGFTDGDISEILTGNPKLLLLSLENAISPSINFLKTILPCKDSLIRVLTGMSTLTCVESNVEVLKNRGVPRTCILKGLLLHTRTFSRSTEDFIAAVGHVEDLGLSPKNGGPFLRALGVFTHISRSTFHRKVEVYKQLGWSEDQVMRVIRTYPTAVKISEETIRKKTAFLRDKVRLGMDCLALYPPLLGYSLEKRIIPRCAVLNILMSRGYLEKDLMKVPSRLSHGNKYFSDRYVLRFESEVPDVVNAFRGHMKFQGWDWLEDDHNEEEKPSKAPKS